MGEVALAAKTTNPLYSNKTSTVLLHSPPQEVILPTESCCIVSLTPHMAMLVGSLDDGRR